MLCSQAQKEDAIKFWSSNRSAPISKQQSQQLVRSAGGQDYEYRSAPL